MNYHIIKNRYEVVKYDYPDLFDIKIYYLNDNYCQINVTRLDSSDGWGLILEILIFDIYNNDKFCKIIFGKSEDNIKNDFFETDINLQIDYSYNTVIPKIIYPRKDFLINNSYKIIKNNVMFIDFHIVIYYINDYKIKIIIRRLDEIIGWDSDLKLILYDNENINKKEILNIGKSSENYKYLFKNTKTKIIYHNNHDYFQEIPKIIFQTGYNNIFKNILHFNSIISFIELNPEYTYIYFTDLDSRKFLKEYFSNEINHAYDLLVPGAYKADLIRYCFLYNQGGCYFDCKQILKKPIKTFLENTKKLVLCNDVIDKALLNAVIFSIPKNIIIEKAIKDCIYNIINKLGTNALDITGPTFLYKSIKKYINNDNLLLQNNRPLDDFSDFCKDYYNNNIRIIKTNEIILNRFYKGYYSDYLNTNHYGKLYILNEIYYKNFQIIDTFKICIYPNKYNDTFHFNLNRIDNNNYSLVIKRSDSTDGWYFDLKVLIIDYNLKEHIINIGISENNSKRIEFSI